MCNQTGEKQIGFDTIENRVAGTDVLIESLTHMVQHHQHDHQTPQYINRSDSYFAISQCGQGPKPTQSLFPIQKRKSVLVKKRLRRSVRPSSRPDLA